MKCISCDQLLTDTESVRKDAETKQYLDMCNYCLVMSRPYNIEKLDEDNEDLTSMVIKKE